jgi:hypothetical protein
MKHFGMASVLLAILGCGGGVSSSLSQSKEALDGAPDPVLAWNETVLQLIVPGGPGNKPPPIGFVDSAIVHTASQSHLAGRMQSTVPIPPELLEAAPREVLSCVA